MSIFKTAFVLLALVSMTMGGIYVKNSAVEKEAAFKISQIAPVIVFQNGLVRFPERIPSPETVFQIQTAVRTDDAQSLNDLLIKHRFYLLPGPKYKYGPKFK